MNRSENVSSPLSAVENDHFARDVLDIQIVEARKGFARLKLEIRPEFLNGLGIVQGGVLFTLADYAFAVCGNFDAPPMVGIESSISFYHPGKSGILWAEAQETTRSRRFCSAFVRILDDQGNLLSTFQSRGFIPENFSNSDQKQK